MAGLSRLNGMRVVICPHCRKEGKMVDKSKIYVCPECKKRSERNGEYLNAIF